MPPVLPELWLLPEAAGADCLGHGSQQVQGEQAGRQHPHQAASAYADPATCGKPSSIGSDGSRDHSFHDPK